ncbi:winged helix-turn-helix domain-containing protein [Micromonospora peucetia]|uniref:DNA-binding transcriptional regulator, ArsR family n=1 Tax=Micromonospora peucetia TaxID=47871 RepID=A0A1C6UFP7_9ACTN|nr:winged helix-turn-helix domain-containing protein [Micromonospora peucetia]MCX4386651.1 winged helix-turn-helix domain-containing protein [Micromonospora peucetia]WSA33982.1 winged helix-turn-helix domain-containing protein [Micromonospora peucetia]SCL52778.1 DNA-binding transcriptional regulator, ArsR family [Micromonospora peucetia]
MLRLRLGPADLCRVRFTAGLHPVGTALLACQVLYDAETARMAPGPAAGAAAATGRARSAASVLRHLLPVRGRLPDFLTPLDGMESVAAGLEAIRAVPVQRVRAEVATAYAQLPATPLRRRFAEADGETMSLFGRALDTWHDAVLAPHWADLTDAHRHQVAEATGHLAAHGLDGLLNALHPAIRWEAPTLTVRTWWSATMSGTGHGLLLLPSPLAGPHPRVLVEPGRPVLVVYPAPMPRRVEASATDPLGRLLGATRAAVLRRLARPGRHTTTALGRAVGISVSSASEHAGALRAAGLVSSVRDGGAVLHRLTPLGTDLLGHDDVPPAGRA